MSLSTLGEPVGFRTTYPLRDVNLEPKLIGFLSRSGTNKTSVGDKKYEKIDIFADNNVFSVANI